MKLSETVERKLAEAAEAWADENLQGKPALLANMVYLDLKKVLIAVAMAINETFKD